MKKFVEKNSPEALLDKLNIRPTRSRLLILYEAMSSAKPFKADDIITAVAVNGMHRSTMFRNINLFKEHGLLREVDMRQESIFYEFNGDNHHHHLVCVKCGCIEDFDICGAENLMRDVLKNSKQFSKITDHSFEMFGVCRKCSR